MQLDIVNTQSEAADKKDEPGMFFFFVILLLSFCEREVFVCGARWRDRDVDSRRCACCDLRPYVLRGITTCAAKSK